MAAKQIWAGFLLLGVGFAAGAGCGVKGDPLPPERPAELGRGRPTYKRATEKIKVESTVPEEAPEDDPEDEE